MTTLVASVEEFDPFAAAFLVEPGGALQKLLIDAPAFYHEPTNAYYILPYANARDVLADSDVYSNVKTKTMPVRNDLRHRIPERYQRVGQLVQGSVANLDPPDHTPQRRAAQRTFTHRRIRELQPKIEAIANDVIDGFVERGSCDLMGDFAARLTVRVVTTLLDVPAAMVPGFSAWIDDVMRIQAPIELNAEDVSVPDDELAAAYERLYEGYRTYSGIVEERVAHPGDDLASAMLALKDVDGRRVLSNDRVLGYMLALTAAGTDTTANLIVNMVRYFTETPDQLERVMENPQLWDNSVCEGLRRSAIACQKYRISKQESEVLGLRIPARARVAVSLAAANSDPTKFVDPLRFDVARVNAAEHLGLGRGRHYCLGSPVVMPEARIALQVLYRRLPSLKADLDQKLEFKRHLEARSIVSQRAEWHLRSAAGPSTRGGEGDVRTGAARGLADLPAETAETA